MSIKKVKPGGKFKGGDYRPLNESKYIGKYPIVFRSSWERKYMKYCDNHDDVLAWSSEPFSIKYFNPLTEKTHDYYPDFWIKVRTKSGKIKQYLIEIKPKSQLIKPQIPKRKTDQAIKNYKYSAELYVKHVAKAKAAKIWAENNGMEYKILTEESLR